MNTFEIKTIIKFGKDSLEYLKNYSEQKVFIVTDPFMVKSGMIKRVTKYLQENFYQVFDEVVPDPPIELIVEGVALVNAYQPDVVIALGGGSAIDAAKAILHFSKMIGNLENKYLIAIPTTSGTGSEVTSFAVVTNKEKGVKYPLVSNELLPNTAILDCELVKSVPPNIVADTGMDVLTHAIEAYVSTSANDFTDAFSEKAVSLVFQYLKRSYSNTDDLEAKEKMHNASCIAGIAFNEASLGLNHAIAHTIGGKLHIPHGRINAILLPHIIEFNAAIEGYNPADYSRAAKKYADLSKLAGFQGGNTRTLVKNLVHEITKLMKELNMPVTLKECNITLQEFNKVKEEIAEGALQDICMHTNPRNVTKSDILKLLEKII